MVALPAALRDFVMVPTIGAERFVGIYGYAHSRRLKGGLSFSSPFDGHDGCDGVDGERFDVVNN